MDHYCHPQRVLTQKAPWGCPHKMLTLLFTWYLPRGNEAVSGLKPWSVLENDREDQCRKGGRYWLIQKTARMYPHFKGGLFGPVIQERIGLLKSLPKDQHSGWTKRNYGRLETFSDYSEVAVLDELYLVPLAYLTRKVLPEMVAIELKITLLVYSKPSEDRKPDHFLRDVHCGRQFTGKRKRIQNGLGTRSCATNGFAKGPPKISNPRGFVF